MLGVGLVLTPGSFANAWLAYSGMSADPSTIDTAFRGIGLALAGGALFGLVRARVTARYRLLPGGVEVRTGLLRFKTNSLRLRDIRSIESKKSLAGMLLGYASLRFHSERGHQNDIVFEHIEDAELVRNAIREAILAEQFPPQAQQLEQAQTPASNQAPTPLGNGPAQVEAPGPTPRPMGHASGVQPPVSEPSVNPLSGGAQGGVSLSQASDEEIYTELARRAELRATPITFESDNQA